MRILLAPTAFKGSFSPAEVAAAFASAVKTYAAKNSRGIFVDVLPIADGGDGTVDSLALALGVKAERLAVHGALGEPRTAEWLRLQDTAIVELASSCGIAALKETELDAMNARTTGLGEVIRHVLEETRIPKLVVALGGSASTDGGAGALAACGAEFLDSSGRSFLPRGGASLLNLASVDFSRLRQLAQSRQFFCASDVENPLLGELGAAHIFGPQKGASAEQVQQLDLALARFADIVEAKEAKSFRHLKGAGAAGGTAFGLLAAFDAEIISGFEWFSSLVNLQRRIADCDLVVSGEGRIDRSSFHGKAIGALQTYCAQHKKRLWLVAGSVEDGLLRNMNTAVEKIIAAGTRDRFADLDSLSDSLYKAMNSSSV